MDKKTKTFLIILLAVYSAALTWIILFKMAVRLDDVGFGTVRAWNLIPFRYSEETSFHLTEVLENVIAFVPLGVYLLMLKTGAWKAILIGAAASVTLEVLQFALGIGAADVTDVITNTAGTAIGVGIYLLLTHIFKYREKLDKTLVIVCGAATVVMIVLIALLIAGNL
ncbi:MAG: VanZ family protein [Clostridia bacterium]|nr:VanZ family protein [Clostridia bacterium]